MVILWPNISNGIIPPQKDTTIMVQFYLWPNQIDKKKFGTCYFLRVWQAQTLHILHKILV